MVGFPRNLRALYVDQLDGASEAACVLEIVMAADADVLRWRQQSVLLQVGCVSHDRMRCAQAGPLRLLITCWPAFEA